MLAHNHITLVLRAFITQAQWNLRAIETKGKPIITCDANGKLSLAAVAESPNGRGIAEAVQEGIPCEILSHKMDIEEPKAALIISQACHNPHQLGMRTSELTAVAVLKGEIIVQMSKDVGQAVAFETVREQVRKQLSSVADIPELTEIFYWLISSGVGTKSYVDDFLEWTSTYVDSQKRRLRFGAWSPINKMDPRAVWSRVAVLKRAYRKKPTLGFCPSPEPAWATYTWGYLEVLEDLLRFFHVGCKKYLAALDPQSRIQQVANIDICAADAFYAAKDPKFRHTLIQIQKILLDAAVKYLEPLGLWKDNEHRFVHLDSDGKPTWIQFQRDAEGKPKDKATAVAAPIAPVVIKFDETTGQQINR